MHAQIGIKKTVYEPRNVKNDVAEAMIFHGTSRGLVFSSEAKGFLVPQRLSRIDCRAPTIIVKYATTKTFFLVHLVRLIIHLSISLKTDKVQEIGDGAGNTTLPTTSP
jgi:hypothetical protein